MSANRVVEHLNVIEYVRGSSSPVRVNAPLDSLLLQCAEEAFGNGVIVAIATATHARHHMVRPQEWLPVIAGELAALIRMRHHAGSRFAFPYCGEQSPQYQIAGHR